MYTLVASLSALGVTVSAVILNEGILANKLREAGIEVVVLDETKLNGGRILVKLIQVIRSQRPDVIHTHRMKENILGSCAALIAGNIPSLRSVHGVLKQPPNFHIPKQIFYFLNRFTGRFMQKSIISVSKPLTKILVKDFPRSKIRIIENGVDVEDIRKRVGKLLDDQKEGWFKVGIVGRLVSVKRIDIVINTARYLINESINNDIEFYVIGEGPLREDWESLSKESGTEKIVHFMGHQDDILSHIQRLDALMMTSNYEGLPMVLLEAMALRVPVIAHKIGGIPGLLDQGKCGILIDHQDPAEYAQAIVQLKEDLELRAQIVENAFVRVTSKYSAKKNAEGCLSEYISIMN
jgi:glycosyltransferase involved in cell wall biosynthesis